jgi:O-antigen/teichoic acid export membrane protein
MWLEFPTSAVGAAISKRVSEGRERGAYISAGFLVNGFLLVLVLAFVLAFRQRINEFVGLDIARLLLPLTTGSVLLTLVMESLRGAKTGRS